MFYLPLKIGLENIQNPYLTGEYDYPTIEPAHVVVQLVTNSESSNLEVLTRKGILEYEACLDKVTRLCS